MKRGIITVLGKDTVGIIAKVCTYLAQEEINILDISQTIVQDMFNMMMIVDYQKAKVEVNEIIDALESIGNNIGVRIQFQREDIFNNMHRI